MIQELGHAQCKAGCDEVNKVARKRGFVGIEVVVRTDANDASRLIIANQGYQRWWDWSYAIAVVAAVPARQHCE